MNITIFGATGGVGHHLVEQAVDAGHMVTAVVRRPDAVTRDVRIVTADLASPDPGALVAAVKGADVVLSALGPRSKEDARARIVTHAAKALIRTMKETGTHRLVIISAVPVPTVPSPARPTPAKNDPTDGFFMKAVLNPIVKAAFRDTYADLAEMEDAVRESGLDWTIVRPPRLVNKPLSGIYRTEMEHNVKGGRSISRADLAHYMLRAAEERVTIGEAVRIGY
jgi:putative NADH-flavin reductase